MNPATLTGWGVRPWDQQVGFGIQQELLPRISAEVSYNRRWFGNFYYTDNRAVGPNDYDRVTITAAYQRNACVTKDYGFTETDAQCSAQADGNLDGHYLAARPPLVVSMTVRGPSGEFPLTAIVAHFKSKSGTDPEGKEFTGRRTEEARLVASIVNDLLAADPDAAIVLLGDLNATTKDRGLEPVTSLLGTAESDFAFSWPAAFPVARIDQVLARSLTVTSVRTLPRTGSDHLPIAAHLRR